MHAQRLEEEFAEKLHVQEPPMVEPDEFEEEEEQEEVVPPVQYMTPPPEEPVDYQIAEDLELEIALLMRKGYTREHAVRFLLDRTSEEVMQTEPQQSYSMKPSNGYEALTPPVSPPYLPLCNILV